MSERFSTLTFSVAATLAPFRHITAIEKLVVGFNVPLNRITNIEMRVLARNNPINRASTASLRILATTTPNYEPIDMVLPDVFPYDISYNSVGSTRFATDVTIVDSGNDSRNSRWDSPLMEYDVAYGVRTMEELIALLQFFRAMKGRLYAFCYQDNTDFTSSIPVKYESRAAPPIQASDQLLGFGNNSNYQFQLTKTYESTSQAQVRIITRPQPGTVLISIGGTVTTDFTVDNTTGIVTLLTPLSVTITGGVSKTSLTGTGGLATVTAASGTPFAAFATYADNTRKITMTGWSHSDNNAPLTVPVTIEAIGEAGAQIVLTYPAGFGQEAESGTTGVTFSIHPAPPSGTSVRAGFQFYVPVRFDTDTLSTSIKDYGLGDITSVKLIEVRPTDTQ